MEIEKSNDLQVESGEKQKKSYLEVLSNQLEDDLANITESGERGLEKIHPYYTEGIALIVNDTIERVRSVESSLEMNQAFKKVNSVIIKSARDEEVDANSELRQTYGLFLEELENNVDEKKGKMLHQILEGMQGEFDLENPENNNPRDMLSVAYKLFIDIAKIRDLKLSDNLKGVEGRASYLKQRSKDLTTDEVQVEVYKMLLGIKKELMVLEQKGFTSI